MVNLELYKIFRTVAKCGSLTKASDELYISQPAISQAIKQLEQQLGIPLFNRIYKGMELSAQGGELIFDDVDDALRILCDVEAKVSAMKESAVGTLRIGASETIFQYCIADRLVEFHNLYPEVKYELTSDVSPKIIEYLKIGKCDVGFLNLPLEADDGVAVGETVMLLNDIFIAGNAFADLKGKRLTVWDLQNYPLLLMEEHTVARTSFKHYCANLGVHLHPKIEIDSWGFMKQLVVDGMGIGCIPREYARNKIAQGTIFELNVEPPLPTRSVGIALPRNTSMSYSLRAFVNLFRHKQQHLQQIGPLQ